MTCPSCGAPIVGDARFCSSCGHELRARGDERRVLTVLFGDLVGFTALSETLDPEQVKNLVDGSFEQLVADITAFGGQVDKIIGDAVVALFGAPVAHEDDAERAVRAALRMQQTLAAYAAAQAHGAPLRMRIGVNTGEVLVGALRAVGSTTAMGDVVNTASRLQTAAEPGRVLVGPATHAATREVIGYEHQGLLTARGRDEPVEAWAAVEALVPPGHRPRRSRTPLVGRGTELGLLGHAVDAAVNHRRAHLVLVLGDAGLGKTRLAGEVGVVAECQHAAAVFEGRCVPYGEANVWWPVAEALRQACDVAAADDLGAARPRTLAAVAAACGGDPAAADVARITDGLLHLMGYDSALRDIDALRAREEAGQALAGFLEAYARQRPVVLALSDLHWADDLVLGLLDEVLERLARLPFLLVGTARPGLPERWSPRAGHHNSVVLHLDPLDRDAAGELLDTLVDQPLAPDLRALLMDRSGGNPFFLEELVALLGDTPAAEVARRDAPGLELPDTLRGLVAARLDGLSTAERATLDDAAVWGRRGPVEALARMAEGRGATHDVEVALDRLVAREVLTIAGAVWSFRSDLVREVAYHTLTKADRARRHHGIAKWLDHHLVSTGGEGAAPDAAMVDRLARHYSASARLRGELGTIEGLSADVVERALHWLGVAAERAVRADHHLVTARLHGEALELLGPAASARRVELLLGRARALAELRDLPEARDDIAAAAAEADEVGDRAAAARAVMLLGDVQQKEGDHATAIATLASAVDRFAELGDEPGRAEALRLPGMAELFAGENERAEASITGALDAFCELGDRRGEAWALQNLAWIAFNTGRVADAEIRLKESIDTFTAIGDTGGLSWAVGLMAFVRYFQGNHDEAEELGERSLAEARTTGDRWATAMMLGLSSLLRLWTGRPAQAVGRAEESLALFEEIDDDGGRVQALATLGRALVNTGRVTEGFDALEEAVRSDRRDPSADDLALATTVLVSAAAQIGDPERALAADVGRVSAGEDVDLHLLGQVDRLGAVGLALAQAGRIDEAYSLLRRAADAGEEVNPFALSALAVAAACSGRTEETAAIALAVDRARRATYLDRVTAEMAAGLGLVRDGDEAGARHCFDAARLRADATGDLVAQALTRLAASVGLGAIGAADAAEVAADARARLDHLGLAATGWTTAFELAAGSAR
ncbi:AAA family ATPase [soil metagenome]